ETPHAQLASGHRASARSAPGTATPRSEPPARDGSPRATAPTTRDRHVPAHLVASDRSLAHARYAPATPWPPDHRRGGRAPAGEGRCPEPGRRPAANSQQYAAASHAAGPGACRTARREE